MESDRWWPLAETLLWIGSRDEKVQRVSQRQTTLGLELCLREHFGDLERSPKLPSIYDAENELLARLRAGDLSAMGARDGVGDLVIIPQPAWQQLEFLDNPLRAAPKFGVGTGWQSLMFEAAVVQALWPARLIRTPGGRVNMADVPAGKVSLEEAISKAGPVLIGRGWIAGLTRREHWLVEKRRNPESSIIAGAIKFVGPDGVRIHDASTELGAALQRDETMRSQHEQVEEWLRDAGLVWSAWTGDDDIEFVDPFQFEEKMAAEFEGRPSNPPNYSVSRAPDPITPLRGGREYADPPARLSPVADWPYWQQRLTAALWEAAALSLDIEPSQLDRLNLSLAELKRGNLPNELIRRIEIACDHAKAAELPTADKPPVLNVPRATVKLSDFGAWADKMGWALSDGFPKTGTGQKTQEGETPKRHAPTQQDLEDFREWGEATIKSGTQLTMSLAEDWAMDKNLNRDFGRKWLTTHFPNQKLSRGRPRKSKR